MDATAKSNKKKFKLKMPEVIPSCSILADIFKKRPHWDRKKV